jgi:phosphatidylglycerophosphate synthase
VTSDRLERGTAIPSVGPPSRIEAVFVVIAGPRSTFTQRLLGCSLLRRHALVAFRAGAGRLTICCDREDAPAAAAEVAGSGLCVDLCPSEGLPNLLDRLRPTGAVVLPCDCVLDVTAAHAFGSLAGPGAIVWGGHGGVRSLPGIHAPVRTKAERRAAEDALCRTLGKPTDNFFARANRRVSIPISRCLVRTSISPNAVSLLGLLVSIGAGACYALGGYRFCLLGAATSWFSSMLDGCDGELARMSFRESALGCWLESVCDDLYYVVVFAGITVGLVRGPDARLALVLGAIALIGFLLTSAIHLALRAKVAALEGPSRFALVFEARMAALGDDPVARFSRAAYKIGTRSTLPYLLAVLAVLGQTRATLVILALGAQLYWTLSLYLWWAAPPSPSPEESP